ncbi:hypothetical protein ZWY2020_040992 [Hordeum vulgare]|nr:hypothetical protein ZWY2020_040992 [Hordeum vulgare]
MRRAVASQQQQPTSPWRPSCSRRHAQRRLHIAHADLPGDANPEEFHIRTLSPVLGSEEKARDAVLYHYKHAASGFSAKLTAKQIEDLKIADSGSKFIEGKVVMDVGWD